MSKKKEEIDGENQPKPETGKGEDSESLQKLVDRRQLLIDRRSRIQTFAYIAVCCSVAFPLIIVGGRNVLWNDNSLNSVTPFVLLYFLIPIVVAIRFWFIVRQMKEDIEDLDFEIDFERFEISELGRRAEKYFRMSSVQLRRYYNLNLNQNIWVFLLGVFCILLGVAVIGGTFWLIVEYAKDAEDSTKYVLGAVGAIGSILVNYVASIFLKMHGPISDNLGAFHGRLVETNQMMLANLIASGIEDPDKRWDAISQLSGNAISSSDS